VCFGIFSGLNLLSLCGLTAAPKDFEHKITPKAFARRGRRGDQDGQAEQAQENKVSFQRTLQSSFPYFPSVDDIRAIRG